ncbi:collagen alpha-2(IX) chain-like [Tupaia chinensis]|uniref:collagen alpha-2(IX) chain-like n=1 Tax=Tupaia chinensis TaxID=246437 RepID=UPI0003C8DAA6|nr:collagen alpha-2(IX) chain-like [Tupaia chinensis]
MRRFLGRRGLPGRSRELGGPRAALAVGHRPSPRRCAGRGFAGKGRLSPARKNTYVRRGLDPSSFRPGSPGPSTLLPLPDPGAHGPSSPPEPQAHEYESRPPPWSRTQEVKPLSLLLDLNPRIRAPKPLLDLRARSSGPLPLGTQTQESGLSFPRLQASGIPGQEEVQGRAPPHSPRSQRENPRLRRRLGIPSGMTAGVGAVGPPGSVWLCTAPSLITQQKLRPHQGSHGHPLQCLLLHCGPGLSLFHKHTSSFLSLPFYLPPPLLRTLERNFFLVFFF